MEEKSLVPELRFEGFTDAWEQRKLGELFAEGTERSSTEEILSVSVANGIYPASESDREVNPGASLANYKVVRRGDIVYNSMRMWQGAVGASRYDGIVSPAYVVAKPVYNLDYDYFGYLLKCPSMLYKYLCSSQGNSKDTQTLKYERFAEIEADVPSDLFEQCCIGALFSSLDALITLRQRKCDKLCSVKKSLLEKMFPKPGELYPELRFEGFTDAWKQRKLGEVARIERGERFTADDYVDSGGIPCIHYGEIYTSYGPSATSTISRVREDMRESLRFANPGDVILAGTSENVEDVCKAVAWLGKERVAYHDDSYALSHSEDPLFLTSFFETATFYVQKASLAHGVKVMRVSSEALAKVELSLPSLSEQRQIGFLFSHLDSLIALCQRELDLLKNVKKSLLEKMFV